MISSSYLYPPNFDPKTFNPCDPNGYPVNPSGKWSPINWNASKLFWDNYNDRSLTRYDMPATATAHEGDARGTVDSGDRLVSSPISQKKAETTFDLYSRTIKIKRPFEGSVPTPPDRTTTNIKVFSDKSKGRLRFVATNSSHIIKTQFCMTYADVWPIDGRSLKKDLNRFLTNLKYYFPSVHFIWIAEFQTRGCPHYHFYSDIPRTDENHSTLARIWHKIAGYKQAKHLVVHQHPKNFIDWDMGTGSYLCKYLDKEAQKHIPAGFKGMGRWWGNSRGIIEQPEQISAEWLDTNYGFEHLDTETGEFTEFVPSKWITRQIGRYQEKQFKKKRYCWFRKTKGSTQSLTGAPIFNRLLEYVQNMQPPDEQTPF